MVLMKGQGSKQSKQSVEVPFWRQDESPCLSTNINIVEFLKNILDSQSVESLDMEPMDVDGQHCHMLFQIHVVSIYLSQLS